MERQDYGGKTVMLKSTINMYQGYFLILEYLQVVQSSLSLPDEQYLAWKELGLS